MELGLPRVVAVDPGCIGVRVSSLPQVTHVQSRLNDWTLAKDLASHGPYTIAACDASVLWADLLEMLVRAVASSAEWLVPCVWVVTLKFPFKTTGSVQRQIELIQERLPKFLNDLSQAMYPKQFGHIRASHQLLHLMANSDSERTLLIVFERDGEPDA